jgi:hypothetical protein
MFRSTRKKRNIRPALLGFLWICFLLSFLVFLPSCGIILSEVAAYLVVDSMSDDDDDDGGTPGPSPTAPAAISDLAAAAGTSSGSVSLTWTATGSTGTTGTATAYVVKHSTNPIYPVNFAGATTYPQTWTPLIAGSAESYTIYGLNKDFTYYFAVVAINANDESSPLSNVPSTSPSSAADGTAPAAITDLAASSGTVDGEIDLTWTAPGDDGNTGMAWSYEVKYSTALISSANYASATTYNQDWTPGTPGGTEARTMSGLLSGQTYYIAIKTRDEVANFSAISNVPSATAYGTLDTQAPSDISGLGAAPSQYWGSIDLTWNAVGDDLGTGTATRYEVRYNDTEAVTDINWNSCTLYDQGWIPKASGQAESHVVAGLNSTQSYYFGIKVYDEANNASNVSNSPTATVARSFRWMRHVVQDWYDVWGSSGTDVFVAGNFGTILHWNGTSWSEMSTGTLEHLKGVWGTSSTDVFAVGENGTIIHYDGNHWASMTTGTSSHLQGIWGSSSTDVYAVGYSGVILHFDGTSWKAMNSGTWTNIQALWGSSDEDIYAVGQNETILHYDGRSWSTMITGGSGSFSGIHGTGADDIFAIGWSRIVHFNGTSWEAMDPAGASGLMGIWAYSPSNVFAAVDQSNWVLHYDGSTWSNMTIQNFAGCRGVWGSSGSDVFLVGWGGNIYRYNGSTWSCVHGYNESLNYWDVWGASSSSLSFVGRGRPASSDDGLITYFNGSSWSDSYMGNNSDLRGIHGFGASDMWAAGYTGPSNEIFNWNGSSWNSVTAFGANSWIYDIHGLSSSDLWCPYGGSSIRRFDIAGGGTWTSTNWGSGSCYSAWVFSSTQIFACGSSGYIKTFDGTTWTTETSPTSRSLRKIWGLAANDVYAVGADQTVVHYNGTNWTTVYGDVGNWGYLYGVWGANSSDIWAVGENGLHLHYDGSSWAGLPQYTWNYLRGVWGTSSTDVYIVGDNGTILKYQ